MKERLYSMLNDLDDLRKVALRLVFTPSYFAIMIGDLTKQAPGLPKWINGKEMLIGFCIGFGLILIKEVIHIIHD